MRIIIFLGWSIAGNCQVYHIMYDFSDGVARVGKGTKFGYINKKGIEIVPLDYKTGYFSEGLCSMKTADEKFAKVRDISAFSLYWQVQF